MASFDIRTDNGLDCCCSLDWMLADGESSHDTLGH